MEEVLRHTLLAPLASPNLCLFFKSGNNGVFRLPGATWDRFRCTVEPSPSHVRCRFSEIFRGPQTPYETKPHMKQHCCCTWQGHPWLAILTVVAADNRPKDDNVSCRVCFVSVDIVGGICGPSLMKTEKPLFHVGFVVSCWV